jgi:hypothetical protein
MQLQRLFIVSVLGHIGHALPTGLWFRPFSNLIRVGPDASINLPAPQADFPIGKDLLYSPDFSTSPELISNPFSVFQQVTSPPVTGTLGMNSMPFQFSTLQTDSELFLSAIRNYNGDPALANQITAAINRLDADVERTIAIAQSTPFKTLEGLKAQPTIVKFLRNLVQGINTVSTKHEQLKAAGGNQYFFEGLKEQKALAKRLQAAMDSNSPAPVKFVATAEFNYVYRAFDDAIAKWNTVRHTN